MTIEEKVLHGGAYLIQDSPPADVEGTLVVVWFAHNVKQTML